MPAINDLSLLNDSSLQGYWQLNNSGTDDSDNSNTLTLQNSAAYATAAAKFGSHGLSLERDSVQHATAAHDSSLVHATTMSWSAWVYFESTTGQQNVMSKWDNNGRSYRFFLQNNDVALALTEDKTQNGTDQVVQVTEFSTNTWYHVGGTYNAGTFKAYVNGAFVGQGTGADTTCDTTTTTTSFAIGADTPDTSAANGFDGYIDDCAFFNRVLTDAEMRLIYGSKGAKFFN